MVKKKLFNLKLTADELHELEIGMDLLITQYEKNQSATIRSLLDLHRVSGAPYKDPFVKDAIERTRINILISQIKDKCEKLRKSDS